MKKTFNSTSGFPLEDIYRCQMGFEDIHPGEIENRQPIQKIVRFEEPFTEAPKTHVRTKLIFA